MSNQITANGLQLDSYQDTVDNLNTALTNIYGIQDPNVNLDPNTPDGQEIGIVAQIVQDELGLNRQTYTSMDPDQAIGVTLDQRVAFNGIKRLPGSYSTTDITIVTTATCTLQGLDGNSAPIGGEFIVQDNAGNQWVLLNSFTIVGATTTILIFRAVNFGASLTTPGTITTPATIVLGVSTVNNPTTQITVGTNQEQDSALRLRRQKSVGITSSGFYDALEAALLNVPGVTYAQVYENTTGGTVGVIPGHSIRVVVAGSFTNADVAQAIYAKRNAGCGMYGAQSYTVIRSNGSSFTVFWDNVSSEQLYVYFNLDAISGNVSTTATIPGAGGTSITVASATGMSVGNLVRATGIQHGTYITSIVGTTIGISKVTTGGGGSGVTTVVVPIIADPTISGSFSAQLASSLNAGIDETLNINEIAAHAQAINSNALVTFTSGTQGLSADGATYTFTLAPSDQIKQFSLAAADVLIG